MPVRHCWGIASVHAFGLKANTTNIWHSQHVAYKEFITVRFWRLLGCISQRVHVKNSTTCMLLSYRMQIQLAALDSIRGRSEHAKHLYQQCTNNYTSDLLMCEHHDPAYSMLHLLINTSQMKKKCCRASACSQAQSSLLGHLHTHDLDEAVVNVCLGA